MKTEEIYSKIIGCGITTYYNWKREKKAIIKFLNENFTNEELEEYIKYGKINKVEANKEEQTNIEYSGRQYLNIFLQKNYFIGDIINRDFMEFYFNILIYAKENINNINIFQPFTIQKASLNYMNRYNNNNDKTLLGIPTFMRKVLNNNKSEKKEPNPLNKSYEIGLELLDDFNCYTNQFLLNCILKDFKPLLNVIQNEIIEKELKIEAYTHILLFKVYDKHREKTDEEKMDLILIILKTLSNKRKKKKENKNELETTPIIEFFDNTSLDAKIKKDLDLIEKKFEKIILAIENYG